MQTKKQELGDFGERRVINDCNCPKLISDIYNYR